MVPQRCEPTDAGRRFTYSFQGVQMQEIVDSHKKPLTRQATDAGKWFTYGFRGVQMQEIVDSHTSSYQGRLQLQGIS